jgi:hypothetical protein
MKKSIIYTAFVFASLCYACGSKNQEKSEAGTNIAEGLTEAKTTEEAVEAISGTEYFLAKQEMNNKAIKIDKPVSLVITKLDDALFSEDLKAGNPTFGEPNKSALNIVTNLEGYENQDKNKPYWFYHDYFNHISEPTIKVPYLKYISIWVIKKDSLIMRTNSSLRSVYGSTKYTFVKK